jgi:CelD/BcsL family acetyltransferase involved in cellulose biosynthesis
MTVDRHCLAPSIAVSNSFGGAINFPGGMVIFGLQQVELTKLNNAACDFCILYDKSVQAACGNIAVNLMQHEIITSGARLAAIATEWRWLHARVARFPFSDPTSFISWWHNRGESAGDRLHVVAGWRDGKLVSLAPMVVTRRRGFRVLEWGGAELYDYCDTLVDDGVPDQPLWNVIRRSGYYDFGFLRDVHPDAACLRPLMSFAREARSSRTLQLRFAVPSSAIWFQERLSASTRSYYRRTERRLREIGPLRFETCRQRPVPPGILEVLLRQKTEWLQANDRRSWISEDASASAALLKQIAETAADAGSLQLSWLECGESVIATHLGFAHRGVLHWYIPTYDMGWSKYAPGRLLLLKLIEWSIDNGLGSLDFLRGEENYKACLANSQQQVADFVFANTYIGRLAEQWLVPWYVRRQAIALAGEGASGRAMPDRM